MVSASKSDLISSVLSGPRFGGVDDSVPEAFGSGLSFEIVGGAITLVAKV